MNINELIRNHKAEFLNLIKHHELNIRPGYYSKPFSIRLSNNIIVFRFYNEPNTTNYKIIPANTNKKVIERSTTFKENYLFYFDKALHKFLKLSKEIVLKEIGEKLVLKETQYYYQLDHALSNTEKEALALGQDITVRFGQYDKSSKKLIGYCDRNIVADLSFFLSKPNELIHLKKESLNQILKQTNYEN